MKTLSIKLIALLLTGCIFCSYSGFISLKNINTNVNDCRSYSIKAMASKIEEMVEVLIDELTDDRIAEYTSSDEVISQIKNFIDNTRGKEPQNIAAIYGEDFDTDNLPYYVYPNPIIPIQQALLPHDTIGISASTIVSKIFSDTTYGIIPKVKNAPTSILFLANYGDVCWMFSFITNEYNITTMNVTITQNKWYDGMLDSAKEELVESISESCSYYMDKNMLDFVQVSTYIKSIKDLTCELFSTKELKSLNYSIEYEDLVKSPVTSGEQIYDWAAEYLGSKITIKSENGYLLDFPEDILNVAKKWVDTSNDSEYSWKRYTKLSPTLTSRNLTNISKSKHYLSTLCQIAVGESCDSTMLVFSSAFGESIIVEKPAGLVYDCITMYRQTPDHVLLVATQVVDNYVIIGAIPVCPQDISALDNILDKYMLESYTSEDIN